MNLNTSTTLKDLVIANPGATRVFEKFGLDYCCGGSQTLQDACQRASLSLEDVLRSLEREEQTATPRPPARNWENELLADLAAFIIDEHHFFTKQELVRLEPLLDKVCARHLTAHPELNEVKRLFQHLKLDLVPHMIKEEQILFPFIAQLEVRISEAREIPLPAFGTVQNPVRMMMAEHDTAGALLRELRRVSNQYTPPPDACPSYESLYRSLEALEADLHQHIHLENNLLFPRAVEMEQQHTRRQAAG
jgi:regulator of cell morphogenesis and NO signaling